MNKNAQQKKKGEKAKVVSTQGRRSECDVEEKGQSGLVVRVDASLGAQVVVGGGGGGGGGGGDGDEHTGSVASTRQRKS